MRHAPCDRDHFPFADRVLREADLGDLPVLDHMHPTRDDDFAVDAVGEGAARRRRDADKRASARLARPERKLAVRRARNASGMQRTSWSFGLQR
jgi:hypothetical protein